MTGHPSSLILERYSVDDLPDAAREGTRAHVQTCPGCRQLLNELDQARTDCLRTLPAEKLLSRMQKTGRPILPRWQWLGLGALTAAAAGLALMLGDPGDRVRLKGLGVAVYCKRGDDVRVLAPDQRIRAGDGLRVVLTLPKRQPAAAWFVDARGRVDRFLAEGFGALDRGEYALPGSAVVDAPCVDLWLIVVAGTGATQRFESSVQRAERDRIPPGEGWAPPGAVVRPLRCE